MKLDIPLLGRRAQVELMKAGDAAGRAADQAAQSTKHAREAAEQAAEDVSGRLDVSGAVQSARRTIEEARRSLAHGSERVVAEAHKAAANAGQLRHQAEEVGSGLRSAVDDVKSLRITRERRRRDPWPGVALVAGVAGGIAAMFLLDPQDGRRRRAILRDKLGKWGRIAQREIRGRAVDLRNRSQGMVHDARSAMGMEQSEVGSEQAAVSGRSLGESAGAGYQPTGSEEPASGATSAMGQEAIGAAVGAGAPEPGGAEYGGLTNNDGPTQGRDTAG